MGFSYFDVMSFPSSYNDSKELYQSFPLMINMLSLRFLEMHETHMNLKEKAQEKLEDTLGGQITESRI